MTPETALSRFSEPRPDPDYLLRGAARTDGAHGEFTRFLSRFSDDQLGIIWKFSGLGELTGDPQAPYPGRTVMARFIQPIPGSWRDILRRAVRTMGNRPELAALRALLLSLVNRPAGIALPAPAPLALSPQRRCHRFTPARAP